MAIYHIVLFKLKPGTSTAVIDDFKQAAIGMVGKVPGLSKVDVGPPHPSTSHRAQGYDMGLVAILDKPETIQAYASHPEHLKVHKIREAMCDETLAYDLEFDP